MEHTVTKLSPVVSVGFPLGLLKKFSLQSSCILVTLQWKVCLLCTTLQPTVWLFPILCNTGLLKTFSLQSSYTLVTLQSKGGWLDYFAANSMAVSYTLQYKI
jgi:hypothetical protein